jgi:hypothetical protein
MLHHTNRSMETSSHYPLSRISAQIRRGKIADARKTPPNIQKKGGSRAIARLHLDDAEQRRCLLGAKNGSPMSKSCVPERERESSRLDGASSGCRRLNWKIGASILLAPPGPHRLAADVTCSCKNQKNQMEEGDALVWLEKGPSC